MIGIDLGTTYSLCGVFADGTPQLYKVRDDVWINFLSRQGKLEVGYGANDKKFGPELGFGHVLGTFMMSRFS